MRHWVWLFLWALGPCLLTHPSWAQQQDLSWVVNNKITNLNLAFVPPRAPVPVEVLSFILQKALWRHYGSQVVPLKKVAKVATNAPSNASGSANDSDIPFPRYKLDPSHTYIRGQLPERRGAHHKSKRAFTYALVGGAVGMVPGFFILKHRKALGAFAVMAGGAVGGFFGFKAGSSGGGEVEAADGRYALTYKVLDSENADGGADLTGTCKIRIYEGTDEDFAKREGHMTQAPIPWWLSSFSFEIDSCTHESIFPRRDFTQDTFWSRLFTPNRQLVITGQGMWKRLAQSGSSGQNVGDTVLHIEIQEQVQPPKPAIEKIFSALELIPET